MSEGETKIKWGVERRLAFIEFRLFWEGGINRSDIIATFGVSEPQASKDLSLYQERAPKNAVYDKNSKRYVASEDFEPVFMRQAPSDYLTRLRSLAEDLIEPSDTWLGQPPEVDIVLTPERDVSTDLLRSVLEAERDSLSIEVLYQSMSKNRPDATWRRMTPHAFAYDGFRWHVRAYCHLTSRFKDFLLPRILGVRDAGAAGRPGTDDEAWQNRFGIVIGPHPDLAPNQKAIVEKDYGMKNGSCVLEVRRAMLFYVLKRLGLLESPEKRPARSQHIVVINRSETDTALREADFAL